MPGGKSDTEQAEVSEVGMSVAPGHTSVSRCADSRVWLPADLTAIFCRPCVLWPKLRWCVRTGQ